jgi:hypothetical protein
MHLVRGFVARAWWHTLTTKLRLSHASCHRDSILRYKPQVAEDEAGGEAVPGSKALVRGTGNAGRCRLSLLLDLVAANTRPELQIDTGLRVESRHVVDGASQLGHKRAGQHAGLHNGPSHACRSLSNRRLASPPAECRRFALQPSFSYTPSNLLDNGHKHRKVATLSNLAVLFSAFASLFQENLVLLDVICSDLDGPVRSLTSCVHMVVLVDSISPQVPRSSPLQLMELSLACRCHEKERYRELSRGTAANVCLWVSFDAGTSFFNHFVKGNNVALLTDMSGKGTLKHLDRNIWKVSCQKTIKLDLLLAQLA